MRLLPLAFLVIAGTALGEPISLFDGKTLEGWDYDPKMWRVEDGVITGGSRTEKITHNDFIATKRSFQNFDLRLKIKVSGDPATGMINSGIQIRSVRVPGGTHMSGYQIDCGKGWFGKIYDEFRRNKVIAEPVDAAALDKVVDVYDWNEYRIRAEGMRIQTWINGVLAIDYTETDKNIAQDGQIAPQVHSGGACLVQVKDITIEELPPTPGLPTWESLGGPEAARKLVAPPAKKAAAAQPKGGRDISYNAIQGSARSAEEQQKLFKLPPGFDIELVVKESEGLGKFISVYFDQRGRMWTQTALEYPVDANENPAAAEALYAGKGRDKVVVYPREALNAPLPPGGLTNPTVFADGLAIPLGILPWGAGDSCYVQHGHDIALLTDTNQDGRADTRKVILTGFGIQDSHLFPHQFTRAPGGWIWMAQGLFNKSAVKKPGEDQTMAFDMCRMARFRPDGSEFEATSVGPNNVWGLVITGEGEAFIQEANDYGYPVMPFHEYAYYPSGSESLKKSYQPDFPPMADFRMGGTGLSGLALGEGEFRKLTPTLKDDGLCMFVANPITSKIQTIAMHRDGPYWKLEQARDLITCDDPFFRPVAMTNGPDGCIYIVDWYNKIISHNEVPRNHPDRDKTRGRIWRVKAKAAAPQPIPDFTKLSADELIATLGTEPTAKAHLAWQTLADRPSLAEWDDQAWSVYYLEKLKKKEIQPQSDVAKIVKVFHSLDAPASRRIQSLWVLREVGPHNKGAFPLLDQLDTPGPLPTWPKTQFPNLDREIASAGEDPNWTAVETCAAFAKLATSSHPETRCMVIRAVGQVLGTIDDVDSEQGRALSFLLSFAKPSLPSPTIQASRGNKQIPVREAYDREFERFLVRMFLERHPKEVAAFLDSEAAAKLPVEARVLASLALEPKASVARIASLLPKLDRAPNKEELLRLALFPEHPGARQALSSLLRNPGSREAVAQQLIEMHNHLDPSEGAPFSGDDLDGMLSSQEATTRQIALRLAVAYANPVEEMIIRVIKRARRLSEQQPVAASGNTEIVLCLNAMRESYTDEAETCFNLAKNDPDPEVRQAALEALMASSRTTPSGTDRLLRIYPDLSRTNKTAVLATLAGRAEGGAKALLTAILAKSIPQADLDAITIERLASVLQKDPDLVKLQQQLGGAFRDVLALDGTDDAWCDSNITLDGPFTLETWVRLTGNIHNNDSILGAQGKIDMNFYQGKFRVWVGTDGLHDVAVSKKPISPDLWTHIAVTRDSNGNFNLYQNGELDTVGAKSTNQKFEGCRIGWSGPKTGTEGAFAEYRVWNHARTPAQIRASFDRSLEGAEGMKRYDGHWGKVSKGARIAKTIDAPPLLSEEQAKALDAKFEKYTALISKGNPANGKTYAALCLACHQIGNTGGQIGPNLSSAGAMGLEAVLRNILTPNAAMEPGYRIFRVEMNNGDLLDAFLVSEDKTAVVVRQPGVPDRRIARTDIRSTRFMRRSLMPEGMLDALPDDAAADLLSYLMTLK
jgi:putative membrane-bound dehydrogenase-like protein